MKYIHGFSNEYDQLNLFWPPADGGNPISSLTFDNEGNFYGTTELGGAYGYEGGNGYGTVYELSPNGSGGWNETVLYNFTGGPDGRYPWYSSVLIDRVGNLYGTAMYGGANDFGVVWELSRVGGDWTETVLYSFANEGDGANPLNGLIFDSAGNLYGTTWKGGAADATVFELSPSGGGWSEQVIYSFAPNSDGYPPNTGLTMDSHGNLYGVGAYSVYELSSNGDGGWNSTVLYTFAKNHPSGTIAIDQAGSLYGVTVYGREAGTVYKLTPGKKKWIETTLRTFIPGPVAGVTIDAAANIYGTTGVEGGRVGKNDGILFELVPPIGAGKYEEKVVWAFDDWDGCGSYGSLILDSAGNLYGTTICGAGWGTVFEITP